MSSSVAAKPACLGGTAVFSPPLPMAAPRLPNYALLQPQFEEILSSGQLTKGPQLDRFEREAADYLGVEQCVGVSSCTSGLMLAFQALLRRTPARVGPAKVLVPSFTFMASISAMVWAGLEPEFIDVDERSMNLCLEELAAAIDDPAVVGVLAVHCFGNPVPSERIEAICAAAGKPLVFDAAHGFGSLHQGRPVGQAGWCQVYSLTPTKMVVAGEGGLIATDDSELAAELRLAREYGNDGSYDSVMAGLNARLSELHCAIALESLKMLEEVVAHRNRTAVTLQQALSAIPGVGFQTITAESRTTYKDFTIVIDPERFGCSRDALAWALSQEGVPSRAYFSPACHQHRAYRQFHRRPLPKTERLAARCLSLPLLDETTVAGLYQALSRVTAHGAQVETAFGATVGR